MSLNFVTRKLKTQKLLEENQEQECKKLQSDIDGTNNGDSDSGTESDEDEEETNRGTMMSGSGQAFVPSSTSSAFSNEDNYSSEEELKEIITSEIPSKKEKTCKTQKTSNTKKQTEKRKWSEVISDDDLADLDELEMTSSSGSRSSRLYVRSSGANTTASSSCSNEEESCICNGGRQRSLLTTPVQFCTSPPMDVHRPSRRKPWTPPPPKVFHVMATDQSFDLEDPEIVDIENRAKPRPAAFVPVNTGNSNRNGVSAGGPVSSGGPQVEAEGGSSVYCPRHHHHTQQGGQTRQTPSPNKRHRLTPRPHNIQRPCLDFEKMQQIKKRVVTSWRPQGAELSLFCW